MNKRHLSIASLVVLLFLSNALLAQRISNIHISPGQIAKLAFNEPVRVTFDYASNELNGLRIFVRPTSGEKTTPNYRASGSPLYPRGTGNGRAEFTISSGAATVDQIRFQIYNAKQSRLIFEFSIPVKIKFVAAKPSHKTLTLKPSQLAKATQAIGGQQSAASTRRVVKRVIAPDGTIFIDYSDGTKKRIDPNGRTGIWDEELQTWLYPMMDVQPATPPAALNTANQLPDNGWMKQMSDWITYLNGMLLSRIERAIPDEASLQNYKNFEHQQTTSIYEIMDVRIKFLNRLLE